MQLNYKKKMNHKIAYTRQAYENTHFLTEHYCIILGIERCPILVIFGTRIPKGCLHAVMLSIPI